MIKVGSLVVYSGKSKEFSDMLGNKSYAVKMTYDTDTGVYVAIDCGDGKELRLHADDLSAVTKFVPDRLRHIAEIYEQRNALYGDNYKHFGTVMKGIFPDGLTVATEDDWNRLGVFVQAIAKMTRYGQQFTKGGHEDSLDDGAVYLMMLQELDKE